MWAMFPLWRVELIVPSDLLEMPTPNRATLEILKISSEFKRRESRAPRCECDKAESTRAA